MQRVSTLLICASANAGSGQPHDVFASACAAITMSSNIVLGSMPLSANTASSRNLAMSSPDTRRRDGVRSG